MRIVAIVLNVVLAGITGLIPLTEGVPDKVHFQVLTFLMLLVPLLTVIVVVRERASAHGVRADGAATETVTGRAAALFNAVLCVAAGWAAVAQYPHPEGNSVIPFAIVTLCASILSLMVLLGAGRRAIRDGRNDAAGRE